MTSASIPPALHPARTRVTVWDRLAVGLLGTLGFTLSYDALQQMAAAIHVRGPLTYLFPMVVDGFIAYGVRALLVLREAAWTARAYAWLLFSGATGASLWANRLHAVRLNELPQPGGRLHLDDQVVGLLSMVAPLALAGAVHLYILIARHATTAGPDHAAVGAPAAAALSSPAAAAAGPVGQAEPTATAEDLDRAVRRSETPEQEPDDALARQLGPASRSPADSTVEALGTAGDETAGESTEDGNLHGGQPTAEPDAVGLAAGQGADGGSGPHRVINVGGRPRLASDEQLVEVIRDAHPDLGTLTRDSARKAVTEAGLGASTDRLTDAITRVHARAAAREHPVLD